MPESISSDLTASGSLYSPSVGLIYVFNLIVGTGALTMPRAFDSAGWLVSLVLVIALAFMSYLTVTFVIEVMALANARRRWDKHKLQAESGHTQGLVVPVNDTQELGNGEVDVDDERRPLLGKPHSPSTPNSTPDNHDGPLFGMGDSRCFDITDRIEMGQMASLFFSKWGIWMFYICIVVYLYGDLAIYAAAVPKSLRDVACTYKHRSENGSTCGNQTSDSDPCWTGVPHISRSDAYRLFLALFTVTLGVFVFFDVQKTKILQIFTSVMRWFAFMVMITLAAIRLAKGKGEGHPIMADFGGVPTLFGVCVYSFMCHHSLPSLVTPIKNKTILTGLFAGDYILILCFYCVLSFTAIFSFKEVEDLYTLNFKPNQCYQDVDPITNVSFFEFYLALFPVFTLSTNFPIIGLTLRNNLMAMCLHEDRINDYSFFIRRICFPLLTVVPPVAVAMVTNSLEILVGITGSYAGAGIQYVVPAALVFYARRDLKNKLGSNIPNQHTSPFKHLLWIIFVLAWAAIAVVFVTANHILTGK